MVDVIKTVLDPNNTLNLSDDVIANISGVLLIVCFVLTVKFLYDFVRGLFPSFK